MARASTSSWSPGAAPRTGRCHSSPSGHLSPRVRNLARLQSAQRDPRPPSPPSVASTPSGDAHMKIGVARETAPGERRVALVPEALGKLQAAGVEVLVERGAGLGALIPCRAYTDAGAPVVSTDELYKNADAIVRVQKPSTDEAKRLRSGQAVVG